MGLELFLNSKGSVIEQLKARDKHVFLDLKFHDIPNTVAAACRWAAGLGVDMFNVHAGGGLEMMQRAMEATAEGAQANGLAVPKLIAVTILTSFDEAGLSRVGFSGAVDENVKRLAALTAEAGLDFVKNSTGIPRCPEDGGIVKPDVVLYEEALDQDVLEGALREIQQADCLIIAGTSLAVYPAAGLIYYFKGKHLVVINKGATPQDANAELVIHDRISTALL